MNQDQPTVEVTTVQAAWRRVAGAAMEAVAGLLTEADTRNRWTLAEALGRPGPHRLHHFLSRSRFDHERARAAIAGLVVGELAGQDVVLVADEKGDAKSSTGCVGAGRQYSGTPGGVGLCQVAVHLAAVTSTTRVVIDRTLYLPADGPRARNSAWRPGCSRRLSSAPSLSGPWPRPRTHWTRASRHGGSPGDEVHSGREARTGLRRSGLGYAVGVAATHKVTDGAGTRWEARQMTGPTGPVRLIPLTCPEPARLLRAFVLPPPVRAHGHVLRWITWRR